MRIRDKVKKVYMIVGCHGSATSLIVRALQKCGAMMGYRLVKRVLEPAAIRKLNKKILVAAGGSWYNPPPEEAILEQDFSGKIQSLVKRYEDEAMWGFKDPRLSLTGRLWLPHLTGDVYLFCCFRKPDRLIKSLETKTADLPDEFSENIDKEFIDRYNRGIISLIEDFCEL